MSGEARLSGWTDAQGSWTNPGSVSSAERTPPPTVCAASYTRTDRPARASSMAAASPLGPAPTTIASRVDVMWSRTRSGSASEARHPPAPDPSDRRRDGADRHVHGRAVAHVTGVLPLASPVDAHLGGLDDRVGCAERRREVRQRPLPERVVHAVRTEQVAELDERVARAFERLRLGNRLVAVAVRGERDPRRERVALRGHERERLAVGIDDHHAGRHLDGRPGDGRDLEKRDLAG